jgi:hypothetical protein
LSFRVLSLSFALALVSLGGLTGCSVLNLSTSCGDDSDCYINERCTDGVCQAQDAGTVVAVQCTALENCPGETYCLGGQCVDLPTCEAADCPDGTFCWFNDNQCRRAAPPCLTDDDCEDDLYCTVNRCNATTLTCEVVGTPCAGETPDCEESTQTCRACTDNSTCDDGVFCNGPEFCVDYACVGGNAPCTDNDRDNLCDEFRDECVECFASDDVNACDDGDPCNGEETCSEGVCFRPDTNPCSLPTPVCVAEPLGSDAAPDGGVVDADGGSADGGAAPDATVFVARCICQTDADCDDGAFCTETDACVDGACINEGNPCEGTGLNCLEGPDECGTCQQDSDCDRDNICEGYESCDLGSGACVRGDPLPCVDPLPVCSPAFSTCVECNLSGDCDPAIPDDDPLWLARLQAEDSKLGCFQATCPEGLTCEYERICPQVAGSLRDVCGCDDGETCSPTSAQDWVCKECNNDDQCVTSATKTGDYCAGANAGCQPCLDSSRQGNAANDDIDIGCAADLPHCETDNAEFTCELCTRNGHCGDNDACTNDFCFGNGCSNVYKCNVFGSRPYCQDGIANSQCVECLNNGQCGGNQPFCNTNADWECKECLIDANCATDGDPDTQFCQANTCVECRNAGDCADGNLCTNDFCNGQGNCFSQFKCNGNEVCDPAVGACVQCLNAGDCNDNDPCTDNECNVQTGQCSFPDKCQADEVCLGNGACVECANNGDCEDGDPCTNDICGGNNTCSFPDRCQANEVCLADGTCVACVNDTECPGAQVCVSNQCVECRNAAQCDDGDNCTANVCNNNSCTFPDACPGEECIPATGVCVECLGNADCNDGDNCTNDVCNNNSCTNPDACPGEACIAATGQCVECIDNNDCSDGDNCTTDTCSNNSCTFPDACPGETCVAATGQCVQCIDNSDCAGNPAGSFCDNNQCVECIGNGDCSDGDNCTTDTCSNNSCSFPDACPGEQCVPASGQCVQCLDDTHCTMPQTCDLGTNTCTG